MGKIRRAGPLRVNKTPQPKILLCNFRVSCTGDGAVRIEIDSSPATPDETPTKELALKQSGQRDGTAQIQSVLRRRISSSIPRMCFSGNTLGKKPCRGKSQRVLAIFLKILISCV